MRDNIVFGRKVRSRQLFHREYCVRQMFGVAFPFHEKGA